MFVLRTFFKGGVESNTYIGNSYIIVDKYNASEEFKRVSHFLDYEASDLICGFIFYNNGQDIIPLYSTQRSYIMNENGSLFIGLR